MLSHNIVLYWLYSIRTILVPYRIETVCRLLSIISVLPARLAIEMTFLYQLDLSERHYVPSEYFIQQKTCRLVKVALFLHVDTIYGKKNPSNQITLIYAIEDFRKTDS